MCLLRSLVLFTFIAYSLTAKAQSIPVQLPQLDAAVRNRQLKGEEDERLSLFLRPLAQQKYRTIKSLLGEKDSIPFKKSRFDVLPVWVRQQFSTHHPYSRNDGSMIPAKGYQTQVSAGFFLQTGILTIQVQPELVMAANPPFATFPLAHTDSLWSDYYTTLNWIDHPERMGSTPYRKLFAGQSSVKLNWKKIAIGLSTENLWWGPGSRNAIVMSNQAPGFPHLTFETREPVKTFLGTIEWRLISGLLKSSGVAPPDTLRQFQGRRLHEPKPEKNRYLNALMLSWQPKWLNGLHLGFARSFYQYTHNIPGGPNGYLPVLGSFFKGSARDENSYGRDQLLSFHLRWLLKKEQAEVYLEYGRNDHSQNASDFLLEPEHSSAYIAGVRKIVSRPGRKDIEISVELADLQATTTGQVRDVPTWYQHHQVKHGYTNQGQIIGAGIGPGANSQTFTLAWFEPGLRSGFQLERVVHNNDFYYRAFRQMRNFDSHWVDLSLEGFHSWYRKRVVYSAQLAVIHSLNYQWRYPRNTATLLDGKKNATNLHFGFTIGYLF